MTFCDDGKVKFSELCQRNPQIPQGEWTQTGKAITINTHVYLYIGLIDGNKITGKRVSKAWEFNVTETWQATFDFGRGPRTLCKQ